MMGFAGSYAGVPGVNLSLGVENLAWYASAVLQAVLLYRFWRLRLASVYPALVLSLAVELAETLILLNVPIGTTSYGYAFILCEGAVIASRVYVVYEIWRKVLESYRSLSWLSRGVMLATVVGSLLLSLLTHVNALGADHEISAAIHAYFVVESTVYTALLFFLFAQALFLLIYPVPLKKNTLLYSFGYSFYFLSMVVFVYLRNLNPQAWQAMASVGRLVSYDIFLLIWVVLFRKGWEVETGGLSVPLPERAEQGLLKQLDALNRVLQSNDKTI